MLSKMMMRTTSTQKLRALAILWMRPLSFTLLLLIVVVTLLTCASMSSMTGSCLHGGRTHGRSSLHGWRLHGGGGLARMQGWGWGGFARPGHCSGVTGWDGAGGGDDAEKQSWRGGAGREGGGRRQRACAPSPTEGSGCRRRGICMQVGWSGLGGSGLGGRAETKGLRSLTCPAHPPCLLPAPRACPRCCRCGPAGRPASPCVPPRSVGGHGCGWTAYIRTHTRRLNSILACRLVCGARSRREHKYVAGKLITCK